MWFRILSVLGAFGLAGCAASGGYPDSPVNDQNQLDALAVYFSPAKMAEYQSLTDANARLALRNEIIYGQVSAYDIKFTQFKIALGREKNIPDTASDAAIAVMGGVGAATARAATKTALLAATSAVTGVKGAIDKDLFYDQALSALLAQMSANRTAVLLRIEQGTLLSDAQYPLTRGLVDVEAYRDAGSIPGALAGVATNAGAKKQTDLRTIAGVQELKMRSPVVVAPASRPAVPLTSIGPQ